MEDVVRKVKVTGLAGDAPHRSRADIAEMFIRILSMLNCMK